MDTKIYDILVSVNRNYTHSISQYDNYSNYYNTLIVRLSCLYIDRSNQISQHIVFKYTIYIDTRYGIIFSHLFYVEIN